MTARHWRRRIDAGICWLTFDKADSTANTLSQEALGELESELSRPLERDARGLVFESAKTTGFILGADVKEFAKLKSAEQGAELAARGQRLLARIEGLGVPTVAAIDGFALGRPVRYRGGLRLPQPGPRQRARTVG